MTDTFAAQLRQLSAAEDFLTFFGVPYEKEVVNVSRLHILKRFYQYLHQAEGLPGLNEIDSGNEAVAGNCRVWIR